MYIVDSHQLIQTLSQALELKDKLHQEAKNNDNKIALEFINAFIYATHKASSGLLLNDTESYIDLKAIDAAFAQLPPQVKEIIAKSFKPEDPVNLNFLGYFSVVPANEDAVAEELRALIENETLITDEKINEIALKLPKESRDLSDITSDRFLQVVTLFHQRAVKQLPDLSPEDQFLLLNTKSYIEYTKKIKELVIKIPDHEAVYLEHLTTVKNRLFAPIQPVSATFSEGQRAGLSKKRNFFMILFPNDSKKLADSAFENVTTTANLTTKSNEIISSWSYRIRSFFGLNVADENRQIDLLNSAKDLIEETNPIQAHEYATLLENLDDLVPGNNPRPIEIANLQRTLYQKYLASPDRSPAQDLKAFAKSKAPLQRQLEAKTIEAMTASNTVFQQYFKGGLLLKRRETVDRLKIKRDQLIEYRNPSDYKAKCLNYIYNLHAEISGLEKFYQENNVSLLNDPLLQQLRNELDNFVKQNILTKNSEGLMNTTLNFGSELSTFIYPIYKNIFPNNAEELNTFTSYLQDNFLLDADVLEQLATNFDKNLKDNPTNLDRFLENVRQGQISSEGEVRQKKPPVPETADAINQSVSKFTANSTKFYNTLKKSFENTINAISVNKTGQGAEQQSQLEDDIDTVTEAITGVVSLIPTVGKTIASALAPAAKIIKEKIAEKEKANKLRAGESFQGQALPAISEYISRHLTQMLEHQISLLAPDVIDKFVESIVYRLIATMGDDNLKHLFDSEPLEIALTKAIFLSNQQTGFLQLVGTELTPASDVFRPGVVQQLRKIKPKLTAEGLLRNAGIVVFKDDGNGNITKEYYVGAGCDPKKYGFIRGDAEVATRLLHYQKIPDAEVAAKYGTPFEYKSPFSGFQAVRDPSVEAKEKADFVGNITQLKESLVAQQKLVGAQSKIIAKQDQQLAKKDEQIQALEKLVYGVLDVLRVAKIDIPSVPASKSANTPAEDGSPTPLTPAELMSKKSAGAFLGAPSNSQSAADKGQEKELDPNALNINSTYKTKPGT